MIRVNDIAVTQNHFPDNSLLIGLPMPPSSDGAPWIKIKWNYENDAELFTLICIRKHYEQYKAVLIMPYIPHARMDRVQNSADVFTLKYFAGVINSLNFSKVYVLDAHSNVSLALIDNVCEIDVSEYIGYALDKFDNGNTALFYPDAGAMKRYQRNSPYKFAYGMKNRDWATGEILGLDIAQKENIVGKDVLIIDDICSRGGTFYYSAKALKEAGAKSVSLYVTHCENTILKGEIFDSGLIDRVYTTHSLIHVPELMDKVIYVDEGDVMNDD